MKKSYFAIGAIAAAMCSCSSESIPSVSEGNVLPGTEELSPISLSMTGTNASVEMGSRTRGTGNVGGANDETWHNEKLYILMTSNESESLATGETWGFTNLNGVGPWLKEQFNGAIWGRVDGTNLVYKGTLGTPGDPGTPPLDMKNNDWYYGAGVDRFYPVNGASYFFAYHIDDAFSGTPKTDPIYTASSGDLHYPQQDIVEAYPAITKEANKMTVPFAINGTQDLMVGWAPETVEEAGITYTGYSAKSARHGVTPNIQMNHLLSRLKFIIHRGDWQAKNIQLTGITIEQVQNAGTMTVAWDFGVNNYTAADLITWNGTASDFDLMDAPANALVPDDPTDDGDNLNNAKAPMVTLTPLSLQNIKNWYQPLGSDGDVRDTNEKAYAEFGGGMFVAPGATTYQMKLKYKVLVEDRDGNPGFNEPTDPEHPGANTDLIETMDVSYTLTAPGDGYEQGKSYNINITVYGLKPITATVELTPWENGDPTWVGGDETDGKPENADSTNPANP